MLSWLILAVCNPANLQEPPAAETLTETHGAQIKHQNTQTFDNTSSKSKGRLLVCYSADTFRQHIVQNHRLTKHVQKQRTLTVPPYLKRRKL